MGKSKVFHLDLEEFNLLIKKLDKGINFNNPSPFEIIEMFKIKNLFVEIDNLKSEYICELKKREGICKTIKSYLGRYFSTYDYRQLEYDLLFLEKNKKSILEYYDLLNSHNVFNDINESEVEIIFNLLPMYYILRYKGFVKKYSKSIKSKFNEVPQLLELIINNYDLSSNNKEIYLPNFTDDEMNQMILNYLSYENCNTIYLRGMILHKNSNDTYIIKRRTRVLINNKYKELVDNRFCIDEALSFKFHIIIDDNLKVPFALKNENFDQTLLISSKYLLEKKDVKITFNRLKTICNIFDEQGRIKELYNPLTENSLTSVFEHKHKNEYDSFSFNNMEGISILIFKSLYLFYDENGESVETTFQWIINEIFSSFYHINGFKSNLKIEGNYQVKCEHIFGQIDSLLRQYRIYVEEREISDDLIDLTTDNLKIGDYKSLVKDKYVEINKNSQEVNKVLYYLFSDQSHLKYVNKDLNGKNFAELILKNKVFYNLFSNFQKDRINDLVKIGIIELNNEFVKIKNYKIIEILKDLYENRFITYCILIDEDKAILDDFIKRDWLIKNNKLFSSYEADFFDYYLNNSKFTNALALRNRYEHGTTNHLSEGENKENYIIGLRIYFIILLKLIDDIEIYQKTINYL